MKFFVLVMVSFFTVQSFAYTIECFSNNNLDVSQYDFEELKIESTKKGNWITINGKTTKLGETLPVLLNSALRPTTFAEAFTVLETLELGSLSFRPGSSLSFMQNRMELQKYRDTVVTFIDFGKRLKINIDCQLKK